MIQLPEIFLNNTFSQLDESEQAAFLESYDKPCNSGLRINSSRITPEEFLEIAPWPLQKVPWIDNGFYYSGEDTPSKHPYYYAGLYYLQEPSAMTPANRLPIEPGDRVLDLCAAPGGKSTELAARLNGTGLLVANDISASRAKGLLKNLELFGLGNILVTVETPEKLAGTFPEFFDKILVDAPCSGEGMFRKDRKMIAAWERQGPEFYGKLQREIIRNAIRMLRPGGLLMYSTCTFSCHEDEEVMKELLNECTDLHEIEIGPYEGFKRTAPGIKIWPHRMHGEGHYLCLLKKDLPDEAATREFKPVSSGKQKLPDELTDFLTHIRRKYDPSCFHFRNEHVYYLPEQLPDLKGLRYLRTGLYFGELKKNRFEPSQALAMTLDGDSFDQVYSMPADHPDIMRYLRGETISCEGKGWTLILVDGFPLGFGKAMNGLLKNKYLPGWRINW